MEYTSDIEVYPPFPPRSSKLSTHKTYLDTKGRPTVTFYYDNLTDRHAGVIYVSIDDVPLFEFF